jgi:hypothetical protein
MHSPTHSACTAIIQTFSLNKKLKKIDAMNIKGALTRSSRQRKFKIILVMMQSYLVRGFILDVMHAAVSTM